MLTEAIFYTAANIQRSSEDKIFSLHDLNNVNSIISKLLITLKSINYKDPDSYNHFHDTVNRKPNQLQSHLYNTMSQTLSDDITQIMYDKIPTNEIHNNKNFFFQQLSCLTANQSNIAGSFLTSTSQSFYNKFSNKEFSTLLCLRYNLDLDYIPTNLPCTCNRINKITGIKQPSIIDKKGFHICNACNADACPTIIHDAVQNVFAQAFKNAGCHVVNKPSVEDEDGKLLVPDHLVLGNATESGQGLMIDYRHTDSGQTNPLDFSEHMLKSDIEKIGKYNAAVSRSGHRFMPIILDKFGNVLQKTRDMLFQMFIRKVSNYKHDIAETEAYLIATKKTNFWLKRASAAMAKTKAMCIINRSTKLIAIQHEKKHGKGSKNSSTYFDNRIDIEQESDVLIADYSFDECNYFKEDDDICA